MRNRSVLALVPALALALPLAFPTTARAEIQKRGPQIWPGKNEISLHIGGQTGLTNYSVAYGIGFIAGGPPSGGRFTFDYGRQLSSSANGSYTLWLDLGFNFIFNTSGSVAFVNGIPVNYGSSGNALR